MHALTFGAELRHRRTARGLTLRSLAERVPVSYSHLSKLETGDRAPTPEVARVLDDALGAEGGSPGRRGNGEGGAGAG